MCEAILSLANSFRMYATLPFDARRRHEYLKNISVPCPAALYLYTGAKMHLHFVWKVIHEAEDARMTKKMSIRDKLRV